MSVSIKALEALKRKFNRHNNTAPATTKSRDWGRGPVPKKGGPTRNGTIDPHAMEKELQDVAREDYEPEHERYRQGPHHYAPIAPEELKEE